MIKLRDKDIRQHLVSLCASNPNLLVRHELPVGRARVDLAIFGNVIHGVEIKSEVDTLDRLPRQVREYNKVFGKLELVTCENHLKEALLKVPSFWGVAVASYNAGELGIHRVREAEYNPCRTTYAVANLLWKEECIKLLEHFNMDKGIRSKPRYKLWRIISSEIPLNTLEPKVIELVKARIDWN